MLRMGIIGCLPANWRKTKSRYPLKRTWTPWVNVFKRDHGRPHSVRRRRQSAQRPRFRQNGRGIMSVLAKAAKIGYKLGRDKRYKRMGAKGATGHYRRLPRPWER